MRPSCRTNPGHGARHALLHMAPKCLNHWATWAGQTSVTLICELQSRCKDSNVLSRLPSVRIMKKGFGIRQQKDAASVICQD